ncbi:acetolactate synthase large subunit [Clostridium sp. AF15-31]|nr:acetolactate synthase large subunit [Clostridium sp. AF15-31]
MGENNKMNVAQMLIKSLEHEGVRYIFGIPGEENLDVMDALKDSDITFITTRHEQGAAFMADVYGRLTGKAGVCLSTLGPGATNLITGVADANSDGAPLVAITGQLGTDKMHLTSHQYLDLEALFKPITKRTKMIMRPESVNEIVRLAFKYAESEKPGATHINLPEDIAKEEVPEGVARKFITTAPKNKEYADIESIEHAAAAIFQAEHPVILAGHSAVRAKASKALTEFATNLKIPVVNTMMAKGIVPYDNPYSMWTIGIPQKDYQNVILEKADLIITVGYDIVEFAPIKWNLKDDHKIIHIDSRPSHVNKLYQPVTEVIGDISDSLEKIGNRCHRTKEPEQALAIKRQMSKEHEQYENDMAYPVKPQKILCDIRSVMGKEDILVSDVGAHKMWISRHYNCYEPNTCLISNGFATMGIAVPGSIAAKMLYPERKVLAVTGDGGFMMNCQEIETAVRMNVPIVVLVMRDDSYGLIKWKQDDRFGDHCFVDFTNPDFVKMAESMHAVGLRVDKTEDLKDVLEQAFASGKVCIIDCPVDYAENTKLTEHLKQVIAELE